MGKYRIVREIGSGGFASVYFARRDDTDQPVALKVLRQNLDEAVRDQVRARFLAERNIASAIAHPAVVKIVDASEPDAELPYLAMEYVEGRPFGQHCRAIRGRLASIDGEAMGAWLNSLARLGHQIAAAMAAAHAKNIVHRDLKPDNVLVAWPNTGTGEPRVKVLDFGIAKAPLRLFPVRQGPTFTRYWTDLGTVMGSPPYMAPEQDGAAHTVTGKADVYALGVMLLLPVAGVDEREVDRGAFVVDLPGDLEALLRRCPELPLDWVQLLRAMVALEPDARPTMLQVARRLQQLGQPNRQFAVAVADWLERGRLPRARALVRFMGWAESAPSLTDEELLFLKRAPVAKLKRFRWAATLGFAAAILAGSSAALAWHVARQRESLRAYETRLGTERALHREELEVLAARRGGALDEGQPSTEQSGTPRSLPKQLAEQLLKAESALSDARGRLRDAESQKDALERELRVFRSRAEDAVRERDDARRRLGKAVGELAEARKHGSSNEADAVGCQRRLQTAEQSLEEAGDRLELCNRALRQRGAANSDTSTDTHARLEPEPGKPTDTAL